MPPRIPLIQCLRTPNTAVQQPAFAYAQARALTSSPSLRASSVTQKRKHHDPYVIAQAKARKAANLTRQAVLRKERKAALGDPVRGITTPYIQSFDTATAPASSSPAVAKQAELEQPGREDPATTLDVSTSTQASTSPEKHLNYFLSESELKAGVEYSQWLSTPSAESEEADFGNFTDDKTPAEREADRKAQESTASEALRRIANLSLGSSKDRMRVNVQRCISDFGRHNTDTSLEPRPAPSTPAPSNQLPKTPRVGPDTGSSEVQIAILTAKIKALADFLETRGQTDRANKRNLRLLVHRRAKLLKYLRRKERGGPRFQNVVDTLGLTDGTWKGEITIMGPLGGHSAIRLAKLQRRMAEP